MTEMTEEKAKVETKEEPDLVPDENLTIRASHVTKTFGSRIAVDNLTFDVRRGEVVGFLGPNGAGKSTTMRLLTSYYTPDSGKILIDGIDTQEQDLVTRSRIGYLPENNPLYTDLLVKEYLSFVADLRGLSKKEKKENIDQTVEEAGLEEYYYRPINQLSKGYRQRVGLAQAILHRPAILVLDEPTEGLDPNQRVTIRNLIMSLGTERTVLLSTHVMQEVETTCDRVLVISRGKLVADSPVQDLLKHTKGLTSIHVEIEGNEVESGLGKLSSVGAIERLEPVEGRKRYVLSIAGDKDPRPEIFQLAKKQNWILWELHEETARMEDVFHSLTAENQSEGE